MTDRQWTTTSEMAGVRLDKYLADGGRLGSRGQAARALERGKVFLNDVEVGPDSASHRLEPGDRVRVWLDRPGSARRRTGRTAGEGELSIVFEDDALVVVNKPAGLLAVPLPSKEDHLSVEDLLVARLRSRGKRRPLVVHRIDRDTSGLVVFAFRPEAHGHLKDQFRRHLALRVYLAVVYGHPSPDAGTWEDTLAWDDRAMIQKETHPRDPRGKAAVSHYVVRELFRETSLVEVTLVTGRRNQIRLQARARGHTLVGERRYVYGPDTLRSIQFPRQALHAHRLGFVHPSTARQLSFEAPLPADMAALVEALRNPASSSNPPGPATGLKGNVERPGGRRR
jgi:23S rRNA pseudouridine1911/1915/1917 synthase